MLAVFVFMRLNSVLSYDIINFTDNFIKVYPEEKYCRRNMKETQRKREVNHRIKDFFGEWIMKNRAGFVKILCWAGKAFIAGVFAFAILSAVTFFYNFTGIHVTNTTGATDYVWQKNQIMFNMKEGFSYVKMDKNGFNNADVFENVDILLMGSSHMEAYQVMQNENCASLLNEYLPEFKTYNIGISGHTIYRIVDNLDSALKEFSPSRYVLIETNTVSLDIETMNEVLNGEASAIKSYDSGLLFYLQKIPAFKPLYNQIDNWLNLKSDNDDDSDNVVEETIISDEYIETIGLFLGEIKKEADKYGIVPVIFYAPNESLDPQGNILFSTDMKYYDVYKTVCESNGIVFIDMSDSFRTLYENSNVLAHGFLNTAVGVGHLNKYGHNIVAEKLAAEISKREGI